MNTSIQLDGRIQPNSPLPYSYKIVGQDTPCLDKPMAVRAKDNSVAQKMLASLAPGGDMVPITRRLVPSTAHTGLTISASKSHHPCTPVCILGARRYGVRPALIPGGRGPNLVQRMHGRSLLDLSFTPLLMSRDVARRSPFSIQDRARTAASARTFNQRHGGFLVSALVPVKPLSRPTYSVKRGNHRATPARARYNVHAHSLLMHFTSYLGMTDDIIKSDSTRYKMVGNGAAVPVFAWVGRRIAAVDLAA